MLNGLHGSDDVLRYNLLYITDADITRAGSSVMLERWHLGRLRIRERWHADLPFWDSKCFEHLAELSNAENCR